jgi:hypothetical protein
MSERLLEELTRWLVKYKGRCKCCGKQVRCGEFASDQNSQVLSNIWNVWLGKTQFLPKSIDSTEKLSLIVSFVITRPNM